MTSFTDQTGFTIHIDAPAKRIVSVVPSQSELLWDLGLREELAGITKFCIHPDGMFRSKSRVGGTKTLNPEAIAALKPDLILANKEENEKMQIESLRTNFPVWTSDISDLASALEMMHEVGKLTGKTDEAITLAANISDAFSVLPPLPFAKVPAAVYVIWNDPIMLAGQNTFIDDMMTRCGFRNVCPEKQGRYPSFTVEGIRALKPRYILLSSEPFPFKEKHLSGWKEKYPESEPLLADGEMFSWYGSRLLKSPGYFRELRERMGYN